MEPQKAILETLKKDREGLMMKEIAEKVHINRITASKYLAVLEAKGLVRYRSIGKAKLFYLNKVRK